MGVRGVFCALGPGDLRLIPPFISPGDLLRVRIVRFLVQGLVLAASAAPSWRHVHVDLRHRHPGLRTAPPDDVLSWRLDVVDALRVLSLTWRPTRTGDTPGDQP